MTELVASFSNDKYEEEQYGDHEGTKLGRVHIERSFSGELEATSTAELLTATAPDGSAAYVAFDAIIGSLGGRSGTFVFEHHGTVSEQGSTTAGFVVPGSGTGELRNLRGEGEIRVDEEGGHQLWLAYQLD
jgi:Protein of unknown function (DUF3224)